MTHSHINQNPLLDSGPPGVQAVTPSPQQVQAVPCLPALLPESCSSAGNSEVRQAAGRSAEGWPFQEPRSPF